MVYCIQIPDDNKIVICFISTKTSFYRKTHISTCQFYQLKNILKV